MSARDRIRAVAESHREPRSVNWISEQADAAWSTTNEELQNLVDQGQLGRVEAGETTCYQPEYTRLLFEEIRTLIEANTREELRSELAAITEEIEEWQGTYDVETWEDLEQSLADDDLASDELRERRDVIAFWRVRSRSPHSGHVWEVHASESEATSIPYSSQMFASCSRHCRCAQKVRALRFASTDQYSPRTPVRSPW